jgi:DNA-binding CsgD family transcriptional regulator
VRPSPCADPVSQRPLTRAETPRDAFPAPTEREILDLVAAGSNNREIAEGLDLSLKTVRNYVPNIFAKLQVADRPQAIVRVRGVGPGRKGDHCEDPTHRHRGFSSYRRRASPIGIASNPACLKRSISIFFWASTYTGPFFAASRAAPIPLVSPVP